MEELKLLFIGKIYDGSRWIYGELWKYCDGDSFKIVEYGGNI